MSQAWLPNASLTELSQFLPLCTLMQAWLILHSALLVGTSSQSPSRNSDTFEWILVLSNVPFVELTRFGCFFHVSLCLFCLLIFQYRYIGKNLIKNLKSSLMIWCHPLYVLDFSDKQVLLVESELWVSLCTHVRL